MTTEFRIRSASWAIAPKVVAFRGREGISEIYRFEAGVLWVDDLTFLPEETVGEMVTLEIEHDGLPAQRWSGAIEEVELVLEEGVSSYWRIVFGPRFRDLALSEHSRIFTDASIPAIVRAVLADEGLPPAAYDLRLTSSYPSRQQVCQYRESSLDFIRRWAEREGMHWFFEQGDDAEKLVVRDESGSAETALSNVLYRPNIDGDGITADSIVHFRARRRSLPRSVRLHDYDPMRPRLAVQGKAPLTIEAPNEMVRWGENVTSPDEAAKYARIRSEQLESTREVFEGHGSVVGLRAGARFGLTDHPSLDGEFLVTALRHRANIGNQSRSVMQALGFEELIGLSTPYRVDLTAVRDNVAYRAPVVTAWPRVAGVVTAFVDGQASSAYAQIDDEGRYRVSVHFDEGDTVDGSRSAWVRMLQPHGGAPEGMHFPLRKKTEVALIFLGGDPDRPFILGTTPNPEKPSPVRSGNHTQNVVRTGSNNLLVMEDVAGGQYITWSTPIANTFLHLGAGAKNFVLKTDGRGRIYTGRNFDVDVDIDKTEDVVSTVTETFHSTQDLSVTGAVTEELNTSLTWDVQGPVTNTWKGPFKETVDGHTSETFKSTLTTTVNASLTDLNYAGGLTVRITGDVLERFTASQTTTVNGPLELKVGGVTTETFGSVKRHVKGTYHLGVSGTYKVKSPVLQLNAPSWKLLSSSAKKIVSNLIEVKGAQGKARATEKSSVVLAIGVTGLAADLKGVSLSLTTSLEIKANGPEIKKTGVEANCQPIVAEKVGFMLITGGLKLAS